MAKRRYYTKKRSAGKIIGKVIGWTLLAGLVAGVVCFFTVPSFHTWIANGWQEFINLFKK